MAAAVAVAAGQESKVATWTVAAAAAAFAAAALEGSAQKCKHGQAVSDAGAAAVAAYTAAHRALVYQSVGPASYTGICKGDAMRARHRVPPPLLAGRAQAGHVPRTRAASADQRSFLALQTVRRH